MQNFKLTEEIVAIVYGLIEPLTVPVYRGLKPTKDIYSEYVIVNSLPINADVMQKCYVNVNYHVKDLADGVADDTKLIAGGQAVLTLIKKVTTATYMIDFESSEKIRQEAHGEHFLNLRFSFKFINT